MYAMSGEGGDGTPIVRDANGRITSMIEYINGVTHSWAITYDARGRLESVVRDGTTTTYEYDPNGNLTGINGAPFGTYDAQDRMVTFVPPGGASWTLSYTNNGDLLTKVTSAGTSTYQYDLRGALRSLRRVGKRHGERHDVRGGGCLRAVPALRVCRRDVRPGDGARAVRGAGL